MEHLLELSAGYGQVVCKNAGHIQRHVRRANKVWSATKITTKTCNTEEASYRWPLVSEQTSGCERGQTEPGKTRRVLQVKGGREEGEGEGEGGGERGRGVSGWLEVT